VYLMVGCQGFECWSCAIRLWRKFAKIFVWLPFRLR